MERLPQAADRPHLGERLRPLFFLCRLLVVTLLGSMALAATGASLRIDEALVVPSAAPRFPVDLAGNVRRLPDDWSDWRGDGSGPVWYRIAFDPPQVANDLLALYIPRACSQYELQLNGHLLHRAGSPRNPGTQLCNRPQLVTLPASLLQAADNMLDLRVIGEPLSHVASRLRSGGLSDMEIGPLATLARRQSLATAVQVGIPQSASATLVLMGGFMLVLGWRHRRESYLAYFGALSFGWALVEARQWLPIVPLTTAATEFLQCALLAFVTLAAVQFLLRYANWRSARIGHLLGLQCALTPAALVLGGPGHLYAMASFWVTLFAFEIAAAALFHLWRRRQVTGALPWPAAMLLAVVGAALIVDLLARHLALPGSLVSTAQLVIPLGLVLVGLRLVQQHGQALHAAEATRQHLEVRIREATAEIEHNFRQLSEMRVEQVTERERKRIAADLHDDLGAKLLTIVHTSDDPRISTLAREALEEMRLSVRGLTGKPMRLGDALGDWRAELMSRLTQSGIECEWDSPDDLQQTLPARAYVQTTRILREATNNIIKHSGASRCTFHCLVDSDDLQLTIQDNGNGIPMELDGRLDRGHGMSSMKHRAKQMHGQCLVESGPGYGTVIRLTLSLVGDVHSPP